ncbi:MAG: cell division protein FtsL [Oscillospiraceae bacterium]|nr:cell division protein FtsL [Oscillospiraceae bacterium]MBQ8788702.1 cell division protein FtsL [Oscillospiraceae bacterium]
MVEVAYNLENFAAKTAEQHDTELKTRSLRIIKNRRKTKVIAPVKVILASAMAIVISIVMIYSQVVLTELTSEVSFYENQLTELNTEYVRLQGELEATTSIKTLEEAAETKLGLAKIDSSQVEYVNLTGDDAISVARTGGKYLVKQYWDNFVEFIAEYLPF